MNLFLAVVAGLWYWYAMCRVGYTLQHIFCQPLVMAVPFGLIMGDLSTALIIGAGIEMMYVGLVSNGGNIPADECLAGVVAIPIALASGMDAQSAIVLALPFGLLGVLMDQIKRFINGYFANLADKYAEQGNDKGIERCAILYPMAAGLLLRFPPVFILIYFGTDLVQKILNVLPGWFTNGLSVAGGVLPALGFAITIFVVGKSMLIPFFILGFFFIQYSQISPIGAAIFGLCMTLLILCFGGEKEAA